MVTVLADSKPTARKEHTCDLCSRKIMPGETYTRQENVWDGRMYSWKQCAHCTALTGGRGGLFEWDQLYYDDEGCGPDSMWAYQPRTIAEARWLVQYRRRWTNRAGDLYPIPTAPEERAA